MNLDWQNISAILIVTAALAYVARRLWRVGTKKGPPCAGCAMCGPDGRKKDELVSLEPHPERPKP